MTESKSFNRVATIILTILVIIAMLPILLIVIASFSAESSLIRNGYTYWPEQWSLDAYYYMVNAEYYDLKILWSFFPGNLCWYRIKRNYHNHARISNCRENSFKYRNALAVFRSFLQCYLMVVLYRLTLCGQKFFHIKNTIWALIIPNYLVSAFNVILVKTIIRTVCRIL